MKKYQQIVVPQSLHTCNFYFCIELITYYIQSEGIVKD